MNEHLNILLSTEFIAPVFIAGSLLLGLIFKRNIVRWMLICSALFQIIILSFRPEDYNSDTWNYSKYIDLLSSSDGRDLFLATKFEPLHLLLALITRDFDTWLLAEGVVCILLVIGLVRKIERLETIAVIFGCALPLFSSSLRFATGLLVISYVAVAYRRPTGKFLVMSISGLFSHVSLAIAGFLRVGNLWLIILILMAFLFYAKTDIEILERAGATENAAGGTGIRPFLVLVLMITIVYRTDIRYTKRLLAMDFLSAAAMFLMTFYFFPVMNRWIILLLILKAIHFDVFSEGYTRASRVQEVGTSVFLYALLVVPHLVFLALRIGDGDW